MNRKRTNMILLGGLAVVILFFVVFGMINRSLEQHISMEVQKIKDELLTQKAVDAVGDEKKIIKRALISDDLSPYLITAQRKSNLFKNQQYWDIETRKAIVGSDIISGISKGDAFKGRTRAPQQLEKQIERIEGRIKMYKKNIRNDPDDHYARQKLQDLYMLKSTVKIISENVTTP